MKIKDLDKEYINKKMTAAAIKEWTKAESYIEAFRLGWKAAIRFAQRVEEADYMCIQCGKLLNAEKDEVKLDAGCEPFCIKCYKKVFQED